MRRSLSIDAQGLDDPHSMSRGAGRGGESARSRGILPIFGALIVLVLLASVALGGWNFSAQALRRISRA